MGHVPVSRIKMSSCVKKYGYSKYHAESSTAVIIQHGFEVSYSVKKLGMGVREARYYLALTVVVYKTTGPSEVQREPLEARSK
jgi:hypothetical protein